MTTLRLALGVIVVAFMIGATTGPLLAVLIEDATGARLPVSLCAAIVPGLLMLKANRQTHRRDPMRTSVNTDPHDFEETDEFPGCHGAVDGDALNIIDENSDGIETTYAPGEWVSYTTTAE